MGRLVLIVLVIGVVMVMVNMTLHPGGSSR